MCGIAGKLHFDETHHVDAQDLRKMAAVMAHRGPDGEGVWSERNVGLAHRRLSIIDLRDVAGQPMSNKDGSLWVTFNGEIYNFRELRSDLQARGYRFQTDSDTETIIHAYDEYGKGCLERLRGMFAFAIWDSRQRMLFLARDRVGKKPLYYFVDRDRFVFGSEIKAILADRSVPAEPNPIAIDHHLTWQYVPAPLTAFKGISKLPAAHWMEVRDGKIATGRYWRLHYSPKRKITLQDAIAELKWRMAEAVRERLVSDVPLGAFLSGGIDSSAVVSYMAGEMDQPVRTFCAGFEDDAFDERPYARTVAKQYATDHTELVVHAPVLDILPRLTWHYDEPFGDSSAVPSYAIAELTRGHVTVVLNGDGGDESFAGYGRYVTNRFARYGDIIPQPVHRTIAKLIGGLPSSVQRLPPLRKILTVAQTMAQSPARRYAKWLAHFTPFERHQLYTDAFNADVQGNDPEALLVDLFAQSDAEDWTDATLDVDVNLYLADDLLVKMDRATMAHSLEARSPLLDHSLMEFVASLPPSFKLFGTQKKRIFKAALRGVLPDSILDRPKMGFGVPLASWFRNELKEMSHDILLSKRAIERGYFQMNVIEHLLHQHCHGQEDNGAYLWDLMMLELWHRRFIDADGLEELSTPPRTHSMALQA